MLTYEKAREFAHEWIAAWNAHDLERVLAHDTDDFEMSSPLIATFADEPSGTLTGKAAVGAYWRNARRQKCRPCDGHPRVTAAVPYWRSASSVTSTDGGTRAAT